MLTCFHFTSTYVQPLTPTNLTKQVCALASKWYIEPLRHYSFQQFEKTYEDCRSHVMDDKWDEYWGSCLRDAIILAYNKVPTCDRQLHMKLAKLVAVDIPRLLGNAGLVFAWECVFSEAPEFCGNLLRALAFQGVPNTEVQIVCRQCDARRIFTVKWKSFSQPPRYCPWCGCDSWSSPFSTLLGRPTNLTVEQWQMLVHDRNTSWARLFPQLTVEQDRELSVVFDAAT
jgi:hypothetical protein